ncbi:MAG TPA: ATP-binding protein [Polyangiaceae bacterium]|nr:ATP-binding protein [Polyangiaceae bacterium]
MRDGSESQAAATPARGAASGLRLQGLGARLILAQLLVAVLLLGIAWLTRARSQEAEARVLSVYDHRILPLYRLGQLADSFAVDFVDAVHKVSDGSLSPEQGAARLQRVRVEASRMWQDAERVMTAPAERKLLDQARPVLADTRRSLEQAEAHMKASDVAGLAAWRRTELYGHVDPLTAQLVEQVGAAMQAAHVDLVSLQADLNRTAFESALGLGFAGIFAVLAGVFVASRFVASLRRIERVVQGAAEGDLSLRVALPGNDELSTMAARIDAMISAIQKSQTELSQQARALARSEAEARAASTAKSAFLGNVSHELRTPLNVILGYAQALDRNPALEPDVRHGLMRIGEAGQHLLELIDDVIGVARFDVGALVVKPTPFSPTQLLSELARMLGDRARSRGLQLVVKAVGEVPATVAADRRRLLQVLLNLAGNAVKFTPAGSVNVLMSWQDERLRFQVRDTGPGIAPSEQASLFQTFSQGELGRKSGEGTGLGLHISREIARAMGGDITLESELGRGATFTCEVDAPESLSEPEQALERRGQRAPENHGLSPMLVVDDRATNREVLCTLLRVIGFDAVEAESGEAALTYLEANRPSMVWLDVKMGGIDGVETVKRIREREKREGTPHLPVVVITASIVDLDGPRALALGFDAWVPKPFRAEGVLAAIEALLPVRLVKDATSPAGPVPEMAETVSETFDIQTLSDAERAHLRDLLILGDISAAADWAKALGSRARALVAEISSYRTDGLLAKLKH